MLARPSSVSTVKQCVRVSGARSFFAAKASSQSQQVAVDEEFPGVPKTHHVRGAKAAAVTTSVTSSGLKLASNNGDNYVATLGLEIAAGSRLETDETAGLSQLFAKMAFRATDARSDLRLFRDIESIGGVIHKAAGRDFVRYNISVLADQVDAAAQILAETTLAPRFAHWDVDLQKEQVKLEAAAIAACSEKSAFENVHAAAFYDDVTLGRHPVSIDNIAAFSSDDLAKFYEQYVNTASVALVGSGVEHNQLTAIANEFFAGLPAGVARAKPAAKYVGGESRVKKNAKNTYVALGFETVGNAHAQYPATQVLKALLTQRLHNKKAAGFVAPYEEVGLVGFAGYAAPADAGALVASFIDEIKKVAATAPTAAELAAAKTSAALSVSDVVSSRQGALAQLGKFGLYQRVAPSVTTLADSVTAKAVQELAQKALASRPSIASVGKLSTVPRLDEILLKLK